VYTNDAANDRLNQHFEVKSLKGFGVHRMEYGVMAAGAILHYLDITQHHHIKHVSNLARIEEDRFVWLDRFTIRNLELITPLNEGGKTLVSVLDKTHTPMGARMLRRWIAFPLKNVQAITNRLEAVECFLNLPDLKDQVEAYIRELGDLERIISKVAVQRINPREVVQLKLALKAIVPIKQLCAQSGNKTLEAYADQLNPCVKIADRIELEVYPDPPNQINKGNTIAKGVNAELDELRSIKSEGKNFLLKMQEREIAETGITSLKIAFNNVFGYYIEVRNTHKDKVPETWIRKQTLVSAERYITEELKEYESKILGAQEKILHIESKLYNDLVLALTEYIQSIQLNANVLSQIDCLLSFCTISADNEYVKPVVNESNSINIVEGRHPVIEQQMPIGESYISNNVSLDKDEQQIIIITGPNMSGKSALLRQTALIVLMAQIGCFIPAKSAEIGYVDKIFTRVGASDNISLGESTFMVEMNEAASILNNLSDRSLILLDELGRGTSTYDGISIAWSIVEYIHEHPKSKAKTHFATHYHELNEMEHSFNRVKNYNVTVKEIDNKVIFLRKLVKGGSNHSFGIHVARMAGMPKSLVKRSEEILEQLENTHRKDSLSKPLESISTEREGVQMSFFQLDDPILKQIRDEISSLDINNLTPLEALNKLNEIKKISGLRDKT
jgi:DNA mismatch repair protein MutS